MRRVILDFLELIKLKILFASILTSCLGYILSVDKILWNGIVLFWSCFGLFFIFSAAAALNHLIEKDIDALMPRTKNRPLPSKRVSKSMVLLLIVVFIFIGIVVLLTKSNLHVLICSLLTLFLYDFVYTPLKKITTLNTFVGAIPGALPFLCGWYIGNTHLNYLAIFSFLLFYFWQLPHFYSIAWVNKESYEAGELKMISVFDDNAIKTKPYLFYSTLFFIIFTYVPLYFNFFGLIYSIGVSLLNIILFYNVFKFVDDISYNSAKAILLSSITYPPCILLFILFERIWL